MKEKKRLKSSLAKNLGASNFIFKKTGRRGGGGGFRGRGNGEGITVR